MNTIQFTKVRFVFIGISILLLAGGLAGTLVQGGFNLGVDFQAGLSLRVAVDSSSATIESVRDAVASVDGSQVQTVGQPEDRQFVVRVRDAGTIDSFSSVMSERVLSALSSEFGIGSVEELENTYVGPRFSQDLTRNTVLLTVLALTLIVAYIWFRFQLGYAMASITALVHDVAFMLVLIGTFQIEVSTATIAAILTIIGYSLNDTIVIFDRIRENERLLRDRGIETIINASITQSLSRTLITSITTLLAVTAIYIFATGTVQLFALNLIVGVIVGTYSSIFVASPVLLGWKRTARSRRSRRDAERRGAPTIASESGDTGSSESSTKAELSAQEADRIREELRKKKAGGAGRSSSRAKRKKSK